MSETAAPAVVAPPTAPEAAAEDLVRSLGIGEAAARALVAHGEMTVEQVRRLARASLLELGLDAADVEKIRTAAEAHSAEPPSVPAASEPPARAAVDGDKIVSKWLDTVRRSERPKRRHIPLPAKDSTDVLRKWVDGDDKAMEAWIQASEPPRPAPVPTPAAPPAAPASAPAPLGGPAPEAGESSEAAPPRGTAGPAPPAPPSMLPAQLLEREETVVRWLTGLLDRVKSEQFDPNSLLQEVQDIQRQLFEERARRKQLEDEVEHVKRGSIAVIKYVRSREARAREQAVQAKDAEIAELRLRLLQGGLSPEGGAAPEAGEEGAASDSARASPADLSTLRDLERRLRADYQARESQFVERETELRRRALQLEAEIRGLRTEAEVIKQRERLLALDEGSLPKNLQERLKAFDERERELLVRENELRTRFEEIRLGSDDLDRRRAPLTFKEQELNAWEQQLRMTKQALEIEARRLERMRTEEGQIAASSPAFAEKEKQVEDLKQELARREEELRARETFLHQKLEELESLQRKAAQYEADEFHADAVAAASETKVRTGVRRLDDLMFGGLPKGAQVLVSGPAHTGKDVLARLFIAEGLKVGIPALWVVTDKTYTQIREEMTGLFAPYPEFEARGLVRYVDLYSRSLGVKDAEPNVRLLALTDKNAMDQLVNAVNNFSQELKEKAPTYRLVFETVSTLTAYLDTQGMFRVLQPFVGRRKLDGAAAYYALETGMHSESDLQTLEHMMDGSVNLKIDQLKTFLSVKGAGEAQSRAWIGYTFTKRSFSLGSFSLDHIR